MDDVKREAEKRAKKKDVPIGSAFETEHQRQKNALMNQIGALDGRNIQKIEAHSEQKTDKSKKMRVVAYCRVSTDDIDQAISIKLQIDAYKKKITSNPDWEYMGTYVDMYLPLLIQFNLPQVGGSFSLWGGSELCKGGSFFCKVARNFKGWLGL